MKFAIDRYNVGIETEVKADDFDGQTYIARRRDRFYCPECGEIVFFRAKGGSHPNQFYHQEKTERAPECDKRVDGRSSLSLSQRVGLPLYLSTIIPGIFQISLGFPALGEDMLRKATKANYSVEVSFGTNIRKIRVDNTVFDEESITLVPMSFVPTDGRNYNIRINGDKVIMGLKSKWSDYADGFDIGGAIFSYDGFGGKKIRRGDSISTKRSYFAVARRMFPSDLCIQQEECGKLKIGNTSFLVLRIQINTSLDNKQQFYLIDKYLKNHFGVWLVECLPELVPIWPPVVQSDVFSPIGKTKVVCCSVSSTNSLPSVFVYSDSRVSEVKVSNSYNSVKTVKIEVGGRPVTLSVDRKYVGREMTFLAKQQPICKYEYANSIGDEKENQLSWLTLDSKVLSSDFSVFSNSKMDLYVGTRKKEYRHFVLKDEKTHIPAMENTDELFFVVGSSIIRHFKCARIRKNKVESKTIYSQIRNVRHGQMVPIPRWAWRYICLIKKHNEEELFEAIFKYTNNGLINSEVLRILQVASLAKERFE